MNQIFGGQIRILNLWSLKNIHRILFKRPHYQKQSNNNSTKQINNLEKTTIKKVNIIHLDIQNKVIIMIEDHKITSTSILDINIINSTQKIVKVQKGIWKKRITL
jgi:hypothetical protein